MFALALQNVNQKKRYYPVPDLRTGYYLKYVLSREINQMIITIVKKDNEDNWREFEDNKFYVEEVLLKGNIEKHESNKCECDLRYEGLGHCLAGQYLEGDLTTEEIIQIFELKEEEADE